VKTASKKAFFVVAVLVLAFAIATVLARLGPAQSVPMEGKTAEEVYKNVQVLKGIPADQIIPAMQFMSASLGVECEHCHVEHAFDKDDKKPKQTARKMMQMMFAINKDNFNGHREVTCYSCHHGVAEPVGTPLISDDATTPEPRGAMNPEAAKPAAMPPADQIVDKYVQALGGAEALEKISSRVEKGALTGFGDRQFPIEIYAKAPDKRLSVMHMPNGESITAYDGRSGWLGFSHGPPHPMTPPEANSARMDADFLFALRLKLNFSQLRVEHPEKVGEEETYLVNGVNPGQPPARMYFSQQSGLLVRLVRYVETPLGRNPTQIDYADYREVDGIKVPFRWTLARPSGRFTIQVDQCQQNVPIDDTKFSMPPAPAPAVSPASP
jgi:photosynthetic reaction center cytochrome c subunit